MESFEKILISWIFRIKEEINYLPVEVFDIFRLILKSCVLVHRTMTEEAYWDCRCQKLIPIPASLLHYMV